MNIMILRVVFCVILTTVLSIDTNNVCTFHIKDKLFSLSFIMKPPNKQHYQLDTNDHQTVVFDFCKPFVPQLCPPDTVNAFSFLVRSNVSSLTNITTYQCIPYSSNSQNSNFAVSYQQQASKQKSQLILDLIFPNTTRQTKIFIECGKAQIFQSVQLQRVNQAFIYIRGQSLYGCPIIEFSAFWKALQSNQILFGIVLFLIGTVLLFFGVLMLHVTIFIASYFLSFAIIGGIFTIFLGPNSSGLMVYFSLLFILFLSTLVAYALTRFVNVQLFCVGAFLGFIVGALLNSMFCSIFNVYSIWSLVVLEVVLTVGCGLLAFKYDKQVVVVSSSVTGAYLVVRPISWIFGGFPNEFTLYDMTKTGIIQDVPWTFFLYLVAIVALAILGTMYQLLKITRRDQGQVQPNFITQNVQNSIDKYKNAIDSLIERFKPGYTEQTEHYEQMEDKRPKSLAKDIQLKHKNQGESNELGRTSSKELEKKGILQNY